MFEYRLYIDESGDHSYKHVSEPDKRYLGLTGVLIKKSVYDTVFQLQLEQLKRVFFRYDIDDPPILVRRRIIERKSEFGVLQDQDLNSKWEYGILNYFTGLIPYSQVFTVVIDKEKHRQKYPVQTFNPYDYSLEVLLWRVRGYLNFYSEQADVIAESRGIPEDTQLKEAYLKLRTVGPRNKRYGTAQGYQKAFPAEHLIVKRKDENVAGLQIADLLAAGQKLATIEKEGKPLPRPPGRFTKQLNSIIQPMINEYGQYLLE